MSTDACTFCQGRSPQSILESSDSQQFEITPSASPVACAETSRGEVWICEACYQHALPIHLCQPDLAEIHHQFGLEYLARNRFRCGVASLTQARQLAESADIVASLAYAESALGHREAAVALYHHALKLNPSHHMSRENLRFLSLNAEA